MWIIFTETQSLSLSLTHTHMQIRHLGLVAPATMLATDKKQPKAASVAQMLVQALHSGDDALLAEVLYIYIEGVFFI